jgi:hypothetical protein
MIVHWPARLASLCVLCIPIAACSVGMAISGKNNPDLGAVKVGASRGEVEMHLGSPVNSSTLENGNRVDIYEYQIGNEPSAGRAVGHAAMDVLTLGIWEIAGTPIEGFLGEKYRATVIYGDDDKVTGIKTKASSNM